MTISVKTPTTDQILELAAGFGMHLERSAADSFRGIMAATLGSYARVDELVEPALPVNYPRTSGWRPMPEENPLNAWYWRAEIVGAPEGVLAGLRVAIKDNICVAGVPMANGSRVLEGYVPDVDATVVTRTSTPAARSPARPPARICASRPAATPASPARSAIPGHPNTRPAARPAAAPRWSPRAWSSAPWAAIRAARSGRRLPGAAPTA